MMLTAYGDVELAVKALKNGAADFLLKPWDNQTLIDKVTEAYRSRKARNVLQKLTGLRDSKCWWGVRLPCCN